MPKVEHYKPCRELTALRDSATRAIMRRLAGGEEDLEESGIAMNELFEAFDRRLFNIERQLKAGAANE